MKSLILYPISFKKLKTRIIQFRENVHASNLSLFLETDFKTEEQNLQVFLFLSLSIFYLHGWLIKATTTTFERMCCHTHLLTPLPFVDGLHINAKPIRSNFLLNL